MDSVITPPPAPGELSFTATLRVDPEPGAKRFQGVWLERQDGERWVVAYRAEGPWSALDGQRVEVSGRTWTPPGQAIVATHFRPSGVTVLDPEPGLEPVWVGARTTMVGRFRVEVGEAGTKLEGQPWTVFQAEQGGEWLLLHSGSAHQHLNQRVEVDVWPVLRSPYVAHMGGPHLWVDQVRPVDHPD